MGVTSHIGHFAFTTILLDLMKQTSSKAGSDVRIVVVSLLCRLRLVELVLTSVPDAGLFGHT
jgi:hypothetical protein